MFEVDDIPYTLNGKKIELAIKKIIDAYSYDELVWAQEEPRNMGTWGHLLMHLEIAQTFRVASRRSYITSVSRGRGR